MIAHDSPRAQSGPDGRPEGRSRLNVDCHDARWVLPEMVVSPCRGTEVRFVYDPRLKRGVRFSAGLFFDEMTHHRCRYLYPLDRRFAVLKESPLCAPGEAASLRRGYTRTFTFREGLLGAGLPFVELPYGTNWLGVDGRLESPHKTRLVSFLGSVEHGPAAGYDLRRDVAGWLSSRGTADCYGKGIRPVPGKADAIAPYRFSVCMENVRENWYFTEKLMDCFLCETVPVYWGCPDIRRYLDPRGMLSFTTLDDLAAIMPTLGDALYEAMRPYLLANLERCIAADLHSVQGYHRRLSAALVGSVRAPPLPPWCRSRPLAAVRRLLSRLQAPAVWGQASCRIHGSPEPLPDPLPWEASPCY